MNQIKKNPDDPDFQDLNPDLIRLAWNNGKLKQLIELYLQGDLTWLQTLETMVMSLIKENRKQSGLLSSALKEAPTVVLGLPYEEQTKLIKSLPPPPDLTDNLPKEALTDNLPKEDDLCQTNP